MAITVEIVTPREVAAKAEVSQVRAPGYVGEFGVLPGHAPFLSVLKPGVVTLSLTDGSTQVFVVGRGFVEAGPDRLVVLTDACEAAAGVDKAAAAKALAEAEKGMATLDPASNEWINAEYQADMNRARLAC